MPLACLTVTGTMVSCSDEPDAENFYTFTGEMLSDYLENRAEYSDFKTIVERAKLMDLLATYGHYTCFLPSNEAVQQYLKGRMQIVTPSHARTWWLTSIPPSR